MTRLQVYRPVLVYPPEAFEEPTLRERARQRRIRPEVLEVLAWDYELVQQLQRRAPGHVALRGGAAVQSLLPLDWQRGSLDVDVVTDLPPLAAGDLVHSIASDFAALGPDFSFSPRRGPEGVPMTSYAVSLPLAIAQRAGLLIGGRLLLDIFHPGVLPPAVQIQTELLPFPPTREVPPFRAVEPAALLADKILTLDIGPEGTGLRPAKLGDLPKQLYDTSRLAVVHAGGMRPVTFWAAFDAALEVESRRLPRPRQRNDAARQIYGQLAALSALDIGPATTQEDYLRRIDPGALPLLPAITTHRQRVLDFAGALLRADTGRSAFFWATAAAQLLCLLRGMDRQNISGFVRLVEASRDLRLDGQGLRVLSAALRPHFPSVRALTPQPERLLWVLAVLAGEDVALRWLDSATRRI